MKAVVMAGGEGTRLRPLTCLHPKPLVPIANKPVMEYILELLKKHGITEIIVTLHYLADEVMTYFGDGSNYGLKINYSIEDTPLGTAGSVKKVESYLKDDTFIIISGDALTDIDLTKTIKFHKQKKSLATITLYKVENPLEYGVVITDDSNKIIKFLEKPTWGEVFSDTINTGIYVLEPEIFDHMKPDKPYDFSKELFPKLLKQNKPLYGFVASGYWCDIGNLQQYQQAHQDIFNNKVKVKLSGKKIDNNIWVGKDTQIHPSAKLQGPLIIGKNCRIKKGVTLNEYSAISNNCILDEKSQINRGIIWENTYTGKKSKINNAIICQGNIIKTGAVVSEGAVVGDKCYLGQFSSINPYIKIWPEKNIEPGATVTMSLIWGSKWPGTLFEADGIQGLGNIELTAEFALKLGAAYGSYLEKGAIITTSRDEHPTSRMLNRAIICGLTSVGINVFDLRVMPAAVSRYFINSIKAFGGIHTKISPKNPEIFLIQFLNKIGINVDQSVERKIESVFFREDFRRTFGDEVGKIEFPSRIIDQYVEGHLKYINQDLISKSKFKIVIDYAFGNASLVLPSILGKLGCEIVTLNSYLDPLKGRQVQTEKQKSLEQLSNIVTTLKADLGVLFDWDAENISLVDEKGTVVSDDKLLALVCKLVMENLHPKTIAVPLTAPSVIKALAKKHKCKIIHTKLDSRTLMKLASEKTNYIDFTGNTKGGFIFPAFQPVFDGLFSLTKIIELLVRNKKSLSQIRKELPDFYILWRRFECPWQYKGKVMRQLIETHRNKDIGLVEGVKINTPSGWICIIPDPVDPYLHIYVEEKNRTEAIKLAREYANKINSMKKKANFVAIESEFKDSKLPPEKAFYFWNKSGYLGIKARNLSEFLNILENIEIESLNYHSQRNDFENWIRYELEQEGLAKKIAKLKKQKIKEENFYQKLKEIIKLQLIKQKQ